MSGILLRIFHTIGLTNLSDEQVNLYCSQKQSELSTWGYKPKLFELVQLKGSLLNVIVSIFIIVLLASSGYLFIIQPKEAQPMKEAQEIHREENKKNDKKFRPKLELRYHEHHEFFKNKESGSEEAKEAREDEIKKLWERKKEEIKKKFDEAEQAKMAVKEGDLIAITDVSTKPQKLNEKNPTFSTIQMKKYKGTSMTVRAVLLIDETGNVFDLKLVGSIPEDLKSPIEKAMKKWKYTPAEKNNIKVKVWYPVAINIAF